MTTLGERITDGQADDLALYLPRDVRAPLTDVDPETATTVVRAAFDALREIAAETELENVVTPLPDEYDRLFEHAT